MVETLTNRTLTKIEEYELVESLNKTPPSSTATITIKTRKIDQF